VTEYIDRAVKGRFFTESDGKKMKADLLAAPVVSGGSR
jgi:hypothetical protein